MAAPSAADGTALMHLPTVMTLLREITLKMQDTEQENKELEREVRGLMPVVSREGEIDKQCSSSVCATVMLPQRVRGNSQNAKGEATSKLPRL